MKRIGSTSPKRWLGDRGIMLLALLGLVLFSAPAAVARINRQALVIGNERYAGVPLKNPVNDARKMAEALGAVGFAVTSLYDADLKSITQTVNTFVDGLQPEDVALVFYSGHGVQIDGENFLVPVDFVAHDEADVPFMAYSVQHIQAKLEARDVALTILILDACRDNPYRGFKGPSKGLAAMNAGRGTFIAFATRPGGTAADSPEANNSVFTASLIEAVGQPGLPLDEVFNRVRQRVYEASGRRQLPWTSSSVLGTFYFYPPVGSPSSQVTPGVPKSMIAERAEERADTPDFASDLEKAVKLFESTCSSGDLLGCFFLGEQVESGQGVIKNSARAAALFKKACDGGVKEACNKLKANADNY